jgi:hypothetical protein
MNYPTQLHFVGHFYKNRIMMHGTRNVKTINKSPGLPVRAVKADVGNVGIDPRIFNPIARWCLFSRPGKGPVTH